MEINMGLKLNKISDEIAVEEIKRSFGAIHIRLAKLEASEDANEKLKHLRMLAKLNFEAGALLYQQEAQKEEIVWRLRSAAEYYVRFLSMRDEPKELEHRFVGEFEKAIDLVVCFGEKGLRRELAGIERWQYNFPEYDEHRIRADYSGVEKRFVGEGVLDEAELQRLEDYCSSDRASKEERKFVLPKIRGIKAIVSGDQASLNRAITDLIEAHKWEALRGEYRLMDEGLICLPGMTLAKLALERNMAAPVKSDYLPLRLLE
jgi:Immunity protein 49